MQIRAKGVSTVQMFIWVMGRIIKIFDELVKPILDKLSIENVIIFMLQLTFSEYVNL